MSSNVVVRRPRFLSSWWPGSGSTSLRTDVDHFLESMFRNGEGLEEAVPALDLSETDEAVEVRMNVPGVKSENIDVQLNGNLLTVNGKTEEEKEEKGKTYHRTERRVGQFSRSVTLPCAIKDEQIKATCKDGVLSVLLPKAAEAKGRKIKVGS